MSTPGRDGDDPRRIEPWPEDGLRLELRRYPGFEFLDRTEGQGPIAWSVKILGNAYDRPEGAAFSKAWAAALNAQPGVEVLDSRVWPIPPRHPSKQSPDPSGQAITYLMEPEGAGAQLQLNATTHAAAQALAADAGAAAIAEALAQIGVIAEPWHGQEPTAFPSNLELASNTSLDANGIIF